MSGFDIFAAREILGGQPRNLYTFLRGDRVWSYNSAGRVLAIPFASGTVTYTPALITRGRIQRGSDSGALRTHIKIARTVPIAAELSRYSTFPIYCGIHRWQGAADVGMLPPLQHFGSIANVVLNEGFVECDVVTGEAAFAQVFPSKAFSVHCPLGTYSGRCGVDEAAFSIDATILAMDRSKMTLDFVRPDWTHDEGAGPVTDAVPDSWFDAGQIVWTEDTECPRERVYIESGLTGIGANEFQILGPVPYGAAVGDAVKLVAGDDRSLTTCRKKFNNVRNFLGFDQLPVEDPLRSGFIA